MLTVIGYVLAVLLDVLIMWIGIQFFVRPVAAATGYGVPASPNAYLTIKGVRDFTYGVLGLVVLLAVGLHAEAWFMLVVGFAPVADMVIVLRRGGPKATAYGVHLGTALVMFATSAVLFLA
ncbi:MAG TPA: DUF4267 domain-containing protein [Actinocatenispora sp.]